MDEGLETIEQCRQECEGLNRFAFRLVKEIRQAHEANARLEARIGKAIGILQQDIDEGEGTR